jgi:hypothetical protein
MNQAAAQLAAKGSQDTAIYLKHLATEVDRVLLHYREQQTPISAPSTNSQIESPTERASASQGGREVKVANKLPQNGQKCSIERVAPPKSTSATNDRETATPSIVDVSLPSGNSLPLSMAAVALKASPSQNRTPDSTELELDVSSPWADN